MKIAMKWYALVGCILFLLGLFGAAAYTPNDWFRLAIETVEQQDVENPEGGESERQIFTYDANHAYYLQAGTYNFAVSLENCESTKIDVAVYAPFLPDGENGAPGYLTIEQLNKEWNSVTFSIDVPQGLRTFVVQIETPAGAGFDKMEIQSAARMYTDSFFIAAVSLLVGMAVVVLGWFANKTGSMTQQRLFTICVLCFVVIVCSLPFFRHFIGNGNDFNFHLTRIEGLYRGLQSGQFPVRINPLFANGVGQASPIMYPELFLYLPAFLRFLGISAVMGYKFLSIANIAVCAVLTWYCTAKLTGNKNIGLMASVAYSLGLYHLIDIYARGALGEALAMTFLPCLMLGVYEVLFRDEKQYKWLVIGATGVLQSHLLTLQMCVVICALAALCTIRRWFAPRRLLALAKAAGLSVLCNLWFLLPLLHLTGVIDFGILHGRYNVAESSLYLGQVFSMTSGTVAGKDLPLGSTYGEGLFSLGPVMAFGILLYLLSLLVVPAESETDKKLRNTGNGFLAVGMVCTWCSTDLFPWRVITNIPYVGSFLDKVQFPWRYLAPAALCLSVVFAIGAYRLLYTRKMNELVMVFAALVVCLMGSVPYLEEYIVGVPREFTPYDYQWADNQDYYEQGYTYEWFLEKPKVATASDEAVVITGYSQLYSNASFAYHTTGEPGEGAFVWVPIYYYPGFSAYTEDGTALEVGRGEHPLVHVYIPSGAAGGTVYIRYETPLLYRVGDCVSLAAVLGLAGYGLVKWRKKRAGTRRPAV